MHTIQDLSDEVRAHIRSAYEADVELPSKNQITIWAMSDESINNAAQHHNKEISEMKILILESLEEYGKLLEIRNKYHA